MPSRLRPADDPTRAIDRGVGARIRQRRRSMGMSQHDLGAALGVSFQQIQKYERAIDRISAGRLWLAAKALRVDVGWFFEAAGD